MHFKVFIISKSDAAPFQIMIALNHMEIMQNIFISVNHKEPWTEWKNIMGDQVTNNFIYDNSCTIPQNC